MFICSRFIWSCFSSKGISKFLKTLIGFLKKKCFNRNIYFEKFQDIIIESYEVLNPDEIQASMKKIPLKKTLEKFSDTNSLIIQHEYDHLNGILFLDRIKNPKSYGDPFCLAIADGKEKSMEKRLAESAALNKNLIRGFILLLIAEVLAWKCYIEPKSYLSSI